eukprot:TRINITY_DN15013_c0_g1_i1.p1 TRINITY_DN15013_c0_g1~~TRINITY_DN15013_c0_g1_i1.p1  ORF type:complete len:273 (-),score=34.45 TRINITY_DN15013_c0_g1_i1:289-1056(-)
MAMKPCLPASAFSRVSSCGSWTSQSTASSRRSVSFRSPLSSPVKHYVPQSPHPDASSFSPQEMALDCAWTSEGICWLQEVIGLSACDVPVPGAEVTASQLEFLSHMGCSQGLAVEHGLIREVVLRSPTAETSGPGESMIASSKTDTLKLSPQAALGLWTGRPAVAAVAVIGVMLALVGRQRGMMRFMPGAVLVMLARSSIRTTTTSSPGHHDLCVLAVLRTLATNCCGGLLEKLLRALSDTAKPGMPFACCLPYA